MRKLVVLVIFIGIAWSYFNRESTYTGEFAEVAADTPETSVAACGDGGSPVDEVVAVALNADLRETPNGEKMKNMKASEILGKTHYHQIDNSTTVRRLCVQGEWSEVKIVAPEWLSNVQGWVPTLALRTIQRTADGDRVYVESDFFWDKDASQFKPEIIAIVNKIAREHDGCSKIDTASVAKSPSRSKPGFPVFFVTCGSSSPFNVYFQPSDADKAFKPVAAISQSDAVLACEKAAIGQATHPSTVDFSKIMDVAYSARPDGRVSLDSTFTARNSFNLELKYRIRCLFNGNTLIESQIAEAS